MSVKEIQARLLECCHAGTSFSETQRLVRRLFLDLDAAAPAMDRQERIVEAVTAWGTVEPSVCLSHRDVSILAAGVAVHRPTLTRIAEKLAAERAKGATDDVA
jgi:hypothetical protein